MYGKMPYIIFTYIDSRICVYSRDCVYRKDLYTTYAVDNGKLMGYNIPVKNPIEVYPIVWMNTHIGLLDSEVFNPTANPNPLDTGIANGKKQ